MSGPSVIYLDNALLLSEGPVDGLGVLIVDFHTLSRVSDGHPLL